MVGLPDQNLTDSTTTIRLLLDWDVYDDEYAAEIFLRKEKYPASYAHRIRLTSCFNLKRMWHTRGLPAQFTWCTDTGWVCGKPCSSCLQTPPERECCTQVKCKKLSVKQFGLWLEDSLHSKWKWIESQRRNLSFAEAQLTCLAAYGPSVWRRTYQLSRRQQKPLLKVQTSLQILLNQLLKTIVPRLFLLAKIASQAAHWN